MEILPCFHIGLRGLRPGSSLLPCLCSSPPLIHVREVSPCNPLAVPKGKCSHLFITLRTDSALGWVSALWKYNAPTWALITELFLCKSKRHSVKMLKMRPHLGQYVTNLLVWICEIRCFSEEWSLQFPKPDCYLPVSHPVIHVIYLNFNSLPLVFQVLSHTTHQSLYYFILRTIVHVFISTSFPSWMCLSVTFCLQVWTRGF